MKTIIVGLIIAGIVFFAGSAAASKVSVDLSAGPKAEGQLALDQANAQQIQSQTAQGDAASAQALADQQKLNEATLQARIDKWNALNGVLKWAGGFALGFALIFAAINAMAFFGAINYRLTIKPVHARSGPQVAWTLPMLPFMLVHTTDDAPGQTTLFMPGQVPKLTAHQDMPLLALSRALLGEGDQGRMNNMGNIASAARQLAAMLDGVPRKSLPPLDQE